jgi:hypothetical protein
MKCSAEWDYLSYKRLNTLCGQEAEFFSAKVDGAYSYQCALNG